MVEIILGGTSYRKGLYYAVSAHCEKKEVNNMNADQIGKPYRRVMPPGTEAGGFE